MAKHLEILLSVSFPLIRLVPEALFVTVPNFLLNLIKHARIFIQNKFTSLNILKNVSFILHFNSKN